MLKTAIMIQIEEIEFSQTVKQYRVIVEGLDFEVFAKILQNDKGDGTYNYTSDISHHYIPKGGSEYYSLGTARSDIKSAELILINYLENFTTHVKENKFYKY